MNKVGTMKRNLCSICVGLVVGAVMPIVLFMVLTMAKFGFFEVSYRYFQADIGWPMSLDYILLIPMEIISLFFLARLNKIMAVAALLAATGVTLLLLNFILNLPEIPPS